MGVALLGRTMPRWIIRFGRDILIGPLLGLGRVWLARQPPYIERPNWH